MKLIALLISTVTAHLTGHAIWVLTLINVAFLLFKDVTLFSWWWIFATVAAFLLSIIVILVTAILIKFHD